MTDTEHGAGASEVVAQASGNWLLDPTATDITFTTKAMWLLPVKGSFAATGGTGTVSSDGAASGFLTVDPASVSTGTAKRDAHLLTADFFDVARYPTFRYDVTSVTPLATAGELRFEGSFSAHGQTHPLFLTGTATVEADRLTVTAQGDLDRTDWGLTWTKMGASVHTHFAIAAVFTRA